MNGWSFLLRMRTVLVIYVLLAIGASIQSLNRPVDHLWAERIPKTAYNNYVIFGQAHHHLLAGEDMYVAYPDSHWDLYKYSPTFALVFGVYAHLPTAIGLTLWNLTNSLFLLLGIYLLPRISDRNKALIAVCCAVEMMTSIQNTQSNALMAGLMLMGFAMMERQRSFSSALAILSSVFIKLFGVLAFAPAIFHGFRWRMVGRALIIALMLGLLPLPFVGLKGYIMQLESWQQMLSSDYSESLGYSVMGVMHSWFSLDPNKMWVIAIGFLVFFASFLRVKRYGEWRYRLLGLTSALLWIVIFNHKAESPTFIIAMAGVCLWYFSGERSLMDTILFFAALIFTSLGSTDLFPSSFRNGFMKEYVIKAVPCILVWAKVTWEMLIPSNQMISITPQAADVD